MTATSTERQGELEGKTWFQNIQQNTRVWLTRTYINAYYHYIRNANKFPTPTEIKSFPAHPHLKNRIFYPPNYTYGEKLPLFLDIHGGGFMLLTPAADDLVNVDVARELHCIVISLDYSKAPHAKFPTATNEMVDTILDILEDRTLHFDHERVVLGGHSAGGNLTISVAQSPKLQGKLAGVVSWYPATDFSDNPNPKALLRPYYIEGEVDPLLAQLADIKWAYVKPSQDLKDARLSVVFTDRSELPKHIMVVGAQNDILCHEAWRMARQLAGFENQCDWEVDQVMKFGFERDHVRWLLVKDAKHAFTHFAGGKGVEEVKRKKQEKECFASFKNFMEVGPFAMPIQG